MRWVNQDDGQASVEYALVILMIALVLVFALVAVVGPARALFESIPGLMPG